MKLNHFSSKRKGWGGDRLAGRPARDERILKAGWQRHFTREAGRGGGGGGDGMGGAGGPNSANGGLGEPGLHLGPQHLPPEHRDRGWGRLKGGLEGWSRE